MGAQPASGRIGGWSSRIRRRVDEWSADDHAIEAKKMESELTETNPEIVLPSPPPDVAAGQLRCLRELLRRDYLTTGDWPEAAAQTVEMAWRALAAHEACLALYDPAAGTWSAWTRRGELLDQEGIRLAASVSLLETVRQSGEPILTTAAAPLPVRSKSAARNEIRSVLAVPVWWWEHGAGRPAPVFGGCLYADRRSGEPPFTPDDVELVIDLARLAERILGQLRHLSRIADDLRASRGEVQLIRQSSADAYRLNHCQSRDPGFARHVLEPLRRAAATDKVSVLFLGPTGSGKSHLAEEFHYESGRRDGPFVVLDCGQVTSAEALAAELFGYARRSGFAAPAEGRPGKARLADKGTLFVDEIGALPLELQQRLLRLIHAGSYSPLGSGEEFRTDLRVVAAANQDLAELVRRGAFREDLFWRLGEITVTIPSLDEHPADIPGLAERFLAAARRRCARPEIAGLTAAAHARLAGHPWSTAGNVRGLEHTLTRSVLLAPAGITALDAPHLVFMTGPRSPALPAAGPSGAADPLAALLAERIRRHHGNIAQLGADPEVSRAFGLDGRPVPGSTLRLRVTQLGLDGLLAEARRALEVDLETVREALRTHGEIGAAARALGLTRGGLTWRLRRAGLSVRRLLAEEVKHIGGTRGNGAATET